MTTPSVRLFLGLFVLTAPFAAAQPPTTQTPQTQTGGQAPLTPERRVTAGPPGVQSDRPWSLSIQVFQGFDGNNLGNLQSVTGASTTSGPSTGETTRVRYRVPAGRRTGLTFDAANTVIRYANNNQGWLSDTEVEATQWHQFGRNTTLTAAETAYRSPYYTVGTFPGLGNFAGTDLAQPFLPSATSGLRTGSYRVGIDAKVNHVVDTRTSYYGFYRMQGTGIVGVPSQGIMHDVGGRYTRLINRTFGYHLGYSYGNTRFGGYSPTTNHNIDVGLDLQKALSLTRRTTFTFTTGTTFIKAAPVGTAATAAPNTTTSFQLIGHADVTHYIGQTWAATVAYDRGLQMLGAVLVPYFSDSVSAGIGGQLGQHTTLGLSSAVIAGVPLGITSASRDKAFIQSAWVQRNIGRRWTAYAQYSLYAQRFTLPDVVTVIDVPSRVTRNSARFGLTLVFPANRQIRTAAQPPVRPVR